MSDSLQKFELILKNQCRKKISALYCDDVKQSQDSLKPQDVISSVSYQIKAIQSADLAKGQKKTVKDLQKYKKSTFTNVNNLSILDDETPRQTTKFDTQCITDTQLVNIIEDAEVLYAHQGVTQEFETAFIHTNTEYQSDKTETLKLDVNVTNSDYIKEISDNKSQKIIDTHNVSKDYKTLETFNINKVNESIVNNDNTKHPTVAVDLLSQVLKSKTSNFKKKNRKSDNYVDKNDNKENHSAEIGMSSQFNDMHTHKNGDNEEGSPTLICQNENKTTKLKSPPPLVFNLDQFEHFETIALSLLDCDNYKLGQQRINSQILHKELCFNMNKDIELIDSNALSPVFHEKVDKEFIKNEKTNSEMVLNQLKHTPFQGDSKNKSDSGSNHFQDEILFSSDEEENDINKDHQDLPFTCALETSFYDQSGVLDKTMYVGFQTASNRSIQICTDSFAKAKSLLSDVTDSENITVTSIVHNCDSSLNDKVKGNIASNIEVDGLNINQNTELLQLSHLKIPSSNEIYFMTANNKKINLSKRSLDRCKKVFQDIDLNEKFDCTVKDHLPEISVGDKEKQKRDKYNSDTTDVDLNSANNVVEGFDEEIVQEFENIEMSLEDSKVNTKAVTLSLNTENKNILTSSKVTISDIEDVLKDVPFDEDLNEDICIEHKNTKDMVLSQILGRGKKQETKMAVDIKIKSNEHTPSSSINEFSNKVRRKEDDFVQLSTSKTTDVYFKTIVDKDIEITDTKSVETIHDLQDSFKETVKFMSSPVKYPDSIEASINQPSTSKGFLGFKTANNKNIKISEKAWSKSKVLFNNIDSTELPKKVNKEYPIESMKNVHDDVIGDDDFNNLCTETRFAGFKTASNKDIQISDKSVANTRSIFNDINLNDLLSKKEKCYSQDIKDIKTRTKFQKVKLDEPVGFVGFKSASNKIINVSKEALAQTRNIFIDINTEFSKVEDTLEGERRKKVNEDQIDIKTQYSERKKGYSEIPAEKLFTDYKTVSNKNKEISKDGLSMTKDIFKDIVSKGVKVSISKDYPDFKQQCVNKDYEQPSSNNAYQSVTQITNLQRESNPNNYHSLKSDPKQNLKVLPEVVDKTIFKDINRRNSPDVLHKMDIDKDLTARMVNHDRDMDCIFTSPVLKESAKHPERRNAMFADIDGKNAGNTGFIGFQTASNKQVKISEKALAKTRKIFQDLDENCDFTAQHKITKEKSLYPQEILQENEVIQDNTKVSNANLPINKSIFKVTTFKGFQTASKKPVEISKLALEKSKKLFQDLDEVNIEAIKRSRLENNTDVVSEFTSVTPQGLECGFQTANHQKVAVSEQSLSNAKKLFNDCVTQKREEQKATAKPTNYKIAFQTGNNKAIAISEEALAKSKRLFSEIDDECPINIRRDKKVHKTEDIDSMLDTQVINNFEESLHTEDFVESPKNCKRSGSPILSCPRAKKKKKFEVPYNVKQIQGSIVKPLDKTTFKTNKIFYRADYKKNNIYKLKDLRNMSKNMRQNIDPYLYNFTYENLLQFEFNHDRNDLSHGNMTIDLLKQEFLNSVNAKLIPTGWMDNHLKLILWKLISYEVITKSLLVCTSRNVLEQLKYRYDKELYNAHRPALRKIFEKDDVPSKTMVLCVVGIYIDDVMVSSVTSTSSNIELLLTDGWYHIRCKIDKMLAQIVCSGKIRAGTKIATGGAELLGCEQGVSPWEDTSAIRLKISGNSTRRARWDARLGFHSRGTVSSHLSSIQVLGGKVSKLRVFVARVYPALYVEKFEDGSTVTRSERLENIHQMKTETERQAFMEKLYEEEEKEFADQESQDSESATDSYTRTCMESGSQVAKMMKKSKDPAEFRAQLTGSQLQLLEAHTSKRRDRLLQDIQARVRDRIEKAGVLLNRNVVSLLKIRVAGIINKGDNLQVCKGMISIWKPSEAIQEVIKEGAWIDVLNVIPTAVRYSEIQISANRQSIFCASRYKEPDEFKPHTKLLQRQWYTIRDLAQNPSMATDYNEIDTVGIIFLIDPSIKEFDSKKQPFQNVYLADVDKKIICANFWGGLQKFGFQNVLDTGQVIACVNLQKRAGNTRKSIPQFRVTEFSYFTQTPKNSTGRKVIDEFNKKLNGLDKRKFCQDCVIIKNSFCINKNNENISPYRFMTTDIDKSKNKIFIESPLLRTNKIEDNFNLTGLDFESTFKQDTQMSEEMLKRKKKVNEKIARLSMYGEPPPLSPIHIINKSKQAFNSFKSPLSNNNNNIHNNSNSAIETSKFKNIDLPTKSDISHNVASVENTPQNCGVQREISTSPVLLNRTYVKSVNPVKINFDIKENNDSNIDHFAEEFDGSPPLSLD